MTYFERMAAYVLLAIFILSLPACDAEEDDGQKSSANADTQRKSDAGESDAIRTVKWGLTVYDFDTEAPVEGLEVCVYPALKRCETTDQDGHAVVPVPADSDVGLLIDGSAREYSKLLTTFGTNSEDTDDNDFVLTTTERSLQLADAAGYTYDPKKGTIVAQALDAEWAGVDGVKITLDPAAGTGPVYYGSDGPDKSLTSTTAQGWGLVAFGTVPTGDYTLTWSGKNCAVGLNGWQGKEEHVARAPAIAGVRTLAVAQCE